ncbi:MAG: hypothetical protein JNL05_09355 [Flavobacteriales bacterium]|nr:hypothetical protein [Flavobacteriales bacterium]
MKLEHLFKNTLIAGLLTVPVLTAEAQIGVNTTGAAPNKAALLDLSDATRGLLAPRMLRAERTAIGAPVPNSLLVYQTDDFGTGATSELKGFWYYDTPTASWRRVGSGDAWQLGGNTGTNPATNFIGTTDAQDLSFRVNTGERARLMGAAGANQGFFNVGVNPGTWVPAPQERMEVGGAMRIIGAATAPNAGDIQWNAATNNHEGYTDNVAPSASGWYVLENVFGTRIQEQYIGSSSVTCQYPTTNTSVTTGPRTWPIIDDAAFPNANSVGTLETPYSLFWEDGRHQFLYRAQDFANLNICPFTDITHIAFNCVNGVAQQIRNGRVNTVNTLTAAMPTFILVGLQNNANLAPFSPVGGWNIHAMNATPIQWQGGSFNMMVEFCFDNQDWTTNAAVQSENTSYLSNYSLYCDACGAPGGGSFCGYVACGNPPTGPSSTSSGVLCTGWGWSNGANGLQSAGGCEWNATTSLRTCDGTFQYIGAQGAFSKRPLLALFAQNTGGAPALPRSNYMVAQDGVMIGSAAWATGGAYPNQNFKGPGTISAERGVFSTGLLLSDHVFDSYFDGQVSAADAAQGKRYEHMPIRQMANYVERERHLPTMDGRDKWTADGQFSVDQVTNQMWVTVEAQSLYIKELNERMNALQQYLVEKRLKEIGKR